MRRERAGSYNLAELFESVATAVGDREALIMGDRRLTFAELDERSDRLAGALAARGVGEGTAVGLQMENDPAYIEGMLAAFKLRAIPVNVNFRYVEGELRYLFNDAGLHTLIVHRRFVPRVRAVAAEVPTLRHVLVVDDDSQVDGAGEDGSAVGTPITRTPDSPTPDAPAVLEEVPYEQALSAATPSATTPSVATPLSSDDRYVVYTGGTTGMPKGVLWRHEDIFFAAMGGGDPFQFGDWITDPGQLVDRIPEHPMVALPVPPFMHASAHWLAFHQLFGGGKVVIPPYGRFDPATILDCIGRERVTTLVIVGDAIARPLIEELQAHPDRYDTSTLMAIGSGGAILSPAVKAQLTSLIPQVIVVDTFGSSETGTVGSTATTAGADATGARFTVGAHTAVLGDDLQPVEPGSGAIGRLARSGHVPIGYHNDPVKTAATIVTSEGRRWVLPGDLATVDADGTVVLLGRGSQSINTGGEKVFPEEVEVACTTHPLVRDALVVGVDDPRWGQRVVAVVELNLPPYNPPDDGAGSTGTLTLAALQDHCRSQLAGYKIPRDLVVVDHVVRSPAGKADYRWAREQALAAAT